MSNIAISLKNIISIFFPTHPILYDTINFPVKHLLWFSYATHSTYHVALKVRILLSTVKASDYIAVTMKFTRSTKQPEPSDTLFPLSSIMDR